MMLSQLYRVFILMSSAKSFFRHNLILAAHIRSERGGYVYAAVLIKIVFQKRDKHSGGCNDGVVKGMCKIFALSSTT